MKMHNEHLVQLHTSASKIHPGAAAMTLIQTLGYNLSKGIMNADDAVEVISALYDENLGDRLDFMSTLIDDLLCALL